MKVQKVTLKNTTVTFIKGDYFSVAKGKGTGSQIAMFSSMEKCIEFDDNIKNTEYKKIEQVSTGKKGGALFYKGTEKMFDSVHPFAGNFIILS